MQEGKADVDSRQKAIDALKKQIREQRTRLDPKLLKLAEHAIAAAMKIGDTVPYDRKTAEAAIETFLKNHPDAKGFRARLLDMIRKTGH